jgi:hypothetical protein
VDYNPDNWVVLKLKPGKGAFPIYKVLAGWSGGYLDSDMWRMNSGITEVKEDDDYYEFHGHSGSVYRCHKNSYGLRMNNAGIYNELREQQQFKGQVLMMQDDTDWMELDFNPQIKKDLFT